MTGRKKLPTDVEAEVLIKSKRRCSLCYGINNDLEEKAGQIAHIDKNRDNHSIDNLAFLCFVHHDKYDSSTSQSKNYTIFEVKKYREKLYNYLTSLYESTFNENDYYEYLNKKISVIAKNLDMVDNKIIVKVPSLEMMKYKRINLELWNKSEYELIINKIEMKNRFSFHYSSADWHPLPFKGKDKNQTFSSIRYKNNHYNNFEMESNKYINLYYEFPECRIGLIQRIYPMKFDFQITVTIPSKELNYKSPDIQREIVKSIYFEFIEEV